MPHGHKPSHSRFARLHPKAYFWIHVAVGLLLAGACAWAFASIAEDLPEKGTMVHVDKWVTAWLQRHGTQYGESIFLFVSLFGDQALDAILVATGILFLARRDWNRLLALIVTCGGGALLNYMLKASFHRARPDAAAQFATDAWSFPSGHATDSLISYGLLTYWLRARFPRWRTPIFVACLALVALIGYARIYLGVHYLSDVMGGYLSGGVWLAVCITAYHFSVRPPEAID